MDSCSGKNVLLQKSELFKKELEKLMKHGETLENEVKKLINKLNETNDPVEYRVSYYKTLKHFDILIDRVVEINCNIELEPLPDPLKNGVQILNIPHLPVINKKHQMNYIDGENPWNFWLTYADKEEFESFSASLWEKFSKGSMEPYNMKPICGDYVCFQEGMKVRRAVIINNHQRDRVKVLDVDNGSVKLLKVQKLFKVDEEIILLHAQALNCYLSEKTDDIHLWSPEVQRIFSGTLRCNKLTVEVVNKRNDIPPSFLVNITAVEYGSFVGGVDVGDCSETCINEWVLDRLLPELRNNTLNCQLSILALDAFCFTNDMQSDILNEEMCKNGFIDSSKECDIIEEESEKSSDSLHSNFKKQENKVEHISASSQLKQSSGGASCIVNNVMRTAGSGSEKKFVASEESNILQTTTRASVCSQLGKGDSYNNCKLREEINSDEKTDINSNSAVDYVPRFSDISNSIQGLGNNRASTTVTVQTTKEVYLPPDVNQSNLTRSSLPLSQNTYSVPSYNSHNQHLMGQGLIGKASLKYCLNKPNNWDKEYFTDPYCSQSAKQNVASFMTSGHNQYWNQSDQLEHSRFSYTSSWANPRPSNVTPECNYVSSCSSQFHSNSLSNGFMNASHTVSGYKEQSISPMLSCNENDSDFEPFRATGSEFGCTVKKGFSQLFKPTVPASVFLGDKVKLKQQISLINPEEELKAMISCIVSPDEIYVHLANTNNVEIDNMEAEMNKHYAEAHHVLMSSKAEAKTLIGRYCACYCRIDLPYNNDHYSLKWYRAEILNWDKDGDILVYLVDHGNKLKVKLFQLQPLLPLFTKFYTMAQRCHLSAVKRPEDGWPDKVIKTLSRFVSLHKAYTLMVVPSSASNSLEVVLYENNDRSCTINSKLLEFMQMYAENKDEELEVDKEKEVEVEKYLKDDDHGGGGGVSDDDGVGGDDDDGVGGDDDDDDDDDEEEEEEDVGKIIEEWNPMEEDFESARNNYKYDDQDPCVAVSGYAPKDEERNCKFFSKFGRCWKKSCQLKHVEVSPGVFTTDKEEVYHQAFNKLILPSKGSVIKLKVTNVTGPNRFFVQVAGNVIGYENGGDSDEKETLSSLMTHLNKPCNVKQLEPLGYSLAGGQLVIVKVEVDGKECFLRARVSEVFDDDTYSVFYCDFGTQDLVSLKNIREVQPKYLHLPFQAVECSLANVELKDSEIGKYEPISKLKELIEGRRLSAMVHKSFQELQHLEIFLEDEKSNDISEQLVESGYYIFIKSDDDNDKNNYHPG
ncbi:uncharacterized protein LOC142325070 isoform X2 [Lycorma delicatula]